jgi:hypothetical protein
MKKRGVAKKVAALYPVALYPAALWPIVTVYSFPFFHFFLSPLFSPSIISFHLPSTRRRGLWCPLWQRGAGGARYARAPTRVALCGKWRVTAFCDSEDPGWRECAHGGMDVCVVCMWVILFCLIYWKLFFMFSSVV